MTQQRELCDTLIKPQCIHFTYFPIERVLYISLMLFTTLQRMQSSDTALKVGVATFEMNYLLLAVFVSATFNVDTIALEIALIYFLNTHV